MNNINNNIKGKKENSKNSPLLSVIIPTYNRAKYIERCLSGVFKEIENDYPNTEVIVIDGGSTDATIDVLKKYNSKISYWISEPDSGVSEAFNKGLKKAKGDVIRGFGDDDELIPGYFRYMMNYLDEHPEIDVLLGQADFYYQRENRIVHHPVKQPVGNISFNDLLNIGDKGGIGWPNPEVAFQRKEIFKNYAGFDTNFSYLAYLEIWLRFAKNGVKFYALPDVIAKRYLTDDSDTIKGESELIQLDFKKVLRKYGGIFWRFKNCASKPNSIKKYIVTFWEIFDDILGINSFNFIRNIIKK